MDINKTASGNHKVNHDRPLFEKDIDAYRTNGKMTEPAVCSECHAVFHEGRWQWASVPDSAHHVICPACNRVKDNAPAGFVILKGDFLIAHADEITRLIRHHAEHEHKEHPLKRIIAMDNSQDVMSITTTDTHLARGIGEAVHHAYQGKLEVDHVAGENLVRVHWSR